MVGPEILQGEKRGEPDGVEATQKMIAGHRGSWRSK